MLGLKRLESLLAQILAVEGQAEDVAVEPLVGEGQGSLLASVEPTVEELPLGGLVILVGVAALLFLACAFVAFFSEHDILNILAMAVGIILPIIGTVLLFMIRRNFAGANGFNSKEVYVGIGAILGGAFASLSGLAGLIGLSLDFVK